MIMAYQPLPLLSHAPFICLILFSTASNSGGSFLTRDVITESRNLRQRRNEKRQFKVEWIHLMWCRQISTHFPSPRNDNASLTVSHTWLTFDVFPDWFPICPVLGSRPDTGYILTHTFSSLYVTSQPHQHLYKPAAPPPRLTEAQ